MTGPLIVEADWPAPANIVAGTTTRAASVADLPATPLLPVQVHGSQVVSLSHLREHAAAQADAVTAAAPGDMCTVVTADCLPVLFCSTRGDEIAAAHAGWRGLAGGVLENTLAAMHTAAPDLLAWFGPAISQTAFEVGEDVRAAFLAHDPRAAACFRHNDRGRWQADLYGLARQRLAACGLQAVYGGGLCTFADERRFYSYRRAGDSGRLLSFVHWQAAANP